MLKFGHLVAGLPSEARDAPKQAGRLLALRACPVAMVTDLLPIRRCKCGLCGSKMEVSRARIRTMTFKTLQPNPLPTTDDDFSVVPAPARRPRRSKSAGRSRLSEPFSTGASLDRWEPRGYSLMRTRRLLMAALRVWELKNGFHNPY